MTLACWVKSLAAVARVVVVVALAARHWPAFHPLAGGVLSIWNHAK